MFNSSGVPVTGDLGSGGRSATAGRVGEGTVWAEEEGEFVVVCAVGLGVWLVHAPVEREGCFGGVAAGTASVLAGRQIPPLPGGGKGAVPTGGWFWHLCWGSQLEHSRLESLHLQQVQTLALHLASLVQMQHD